MKNSTYGVAYLLRKTSLTLKEIRHLELKQFQELFEEVSFQESVDEYQTAAYVASLLAMIGNTIPPKQRSKTFNPIDFLAVKEPRRLGATAPPDPKEELEALAKKFNIKLPAREIKDL